MKTSPAAALWLCAALLAVPPARAEYQPQGRRDPFVRLVTSDGRRIHPPSTEDWASAAGGSGYVLQGIVYEPGREAVAVINQRVFRRGEEFEGMKVLKIEPKSVTIQVHGDRQELKMPAAEEEKTER